MPEIVRPQTFRVGLEAFRDHASVDRGRGHAGNRTLVASGDQVRRQHAAHNSMGRQGIQKGRPLPDEEITSSGTGRMQPPGNTNSR